MTRIMFESKETNENISKLKPTSIPGVDTDFDGRIKDYLLAKAADTGIYNERKRKYNGNKNKNRLV